MYITSELFLGAEYPSSKRLPSFMSCDAMAERPPSIPSHSHGNLGKRKRQNDPESSANIPSAHLNAFRSRPPIAVPSSNYEIFNFHATHLPSPPFDPYTYDDMRFDTSAHSALDNTNLPLSVVDDLPQSKHRRRLHPYKLSRLTALAPANPNATQPSTTPNQSSNFAGSTKHPTPDLRPCRVCHKSPTRQRDLEGYKDCQQCEERACQICTRACLGGCGRQLCSSCCKEVGKEGDAWCLDCLGQRREHPGQRVS